MNTNPIFQLRKSRSLTLVELGRLTGTHPSLISRMERGLLQPSKEFLNACTLALKLTPEEALPQERPKKPLVGLRRQVYNLQQNFPVSKEIPVQPLRVAFTLARYTETGRRLVETLDSQAHKASDWTAIKLMAGQMNGLEQKFALHGIIRGKVQRMMPDEIGFNLPVVHHPRQPWICYVVGTHVYFPQVTLALKKSQPRVDFLLAVPGNPPIFIDIELDGPMHKNSLDNDQKRGQAIALPELRIPSARLEMLDFWEWYQSQLSELLSKCSPPSL